MILGQYTNFRHSNSEWNGHKVAEENSLMKTQKTKIQQGSEDKDFQYFFYRFLG